jgi:hypothetical protein
MNLFHFFTDIKFSKNIIMSTNLYHYNSAADQKMTGLTHTLSSTVLHTELSTVPSFSHTGRQIVDTKWHEIM